MNDSTSIRAPFRNGTFRAIWIASLASNFGGLIQTVGAAWLMTSISTSAGMVALVQTSTTLPIMLLSLASGAIADNFDRRRVMLFSQCFMLVISAALTVSAYLGLLTPWLLLSFTFALGCGTALNNPSWQASVGDIVERDALPAAVTLNSMGFNLARSVGPAVGGIIVAAAGAAAAFAINTLSYVALIAVLVRWKPTVPVSSLPRETLGTAILAGLRYLAMSPNIETVMLRSFVFGLTASAVLALLPLVARNLLSGGPLVYGVLLGAFGVGAVGGALVSSRLRAAMSGETMVRLGFLGFAICAWTAGLSPYQVLTCAGMLLGGACWVLTLSLFNTTVQLSTPRWVVGRLLALYQAATFAGLALGSWIWGVTAEHYGADVALLVAGSLMLGGIALGFRYRLPKPPELDLAPLNSWKQPDLGLDLKPRSGPIVVMIEYRIRQDDVAEFLSAMEDRRRIRRRNGARHWSLRRDIENPALWMESYHSPTWLEHLRYHQRSTLEDALVAERIRALHQGPEKPRVHRMIERSTNWTTAMEPAKPIIDVP